MITEQIRKIADEGQLDECPLTIRELKIIAVALCQVLLGMNHKRIAYPDQKRMRLFSSRSA